MKQLKSVGPGGITCGTGQVAPPSSAAISRSELDVIHQTWPQSTQIKHGEGKRENCSQLGVVKCNVGRDLLLSEIKYKTREGKHADRFLKAPPSAMFFLTNNQCLHSVSELPVLHFTQSVCNTHSSGTQPVLTSLRGVMPH